MAGGKSEGKRNETEKYFKKIKEARKKIDNDAPPLKFSTYVSVGDLYAAQSRLHEVEAANRHLVQSINRIYRTRGVVDCHSAPTFKGSNYKNVAMNNLMIEHANKLLYNILQRSKSKYSKDEQLEDYKRKKIVMIKTSRYPEAYKSDLIDPLEKWTICPSETEENPEKIISMPSKRVKCFFDLEITGERKLGRMYIEIYKDFVPIAAENFLHFTRTENGLGYKGTRIYRIKPKFGLLGGDVENKNGASTKTAYGKPFGHEGHLLKFAGPGVVAAFTLVPGLNFCQFFISFKALPFLQNQFVVIGRVIKSLRTLEMVEEFGTASGIPKKPIVIENCGICEPSQKKV